VEINHQPRKKMKLNRIITVCAMTAALALSATSLSAQDNNGGPGGPGRFRNFDPAQMQQRMLERYQQELGFTNDTDWDAVKPLVQKVMDARRDAMSGMGRGMFGGPRNRGGGPANNRPRGGMFGQPNPDADALQKAIDDNAPASQIKDLLAKYRDSQKEKQAKLVAAQEDLKKVLTVKQEAQAALLGLVD
jgi:Spy/CpxP family protein refolding chaperone